ncbi:tRNA nucleotidyltransferase [Cardiobacteriaceae bacterium TAE3-ERU3]|nr:tRNA nucleotidyltransferase [Cardiobacteriaceae bacterium TAE3-ERU3]
MQVYLVGGAVRDKLLGLAVKDRDYVVVGATPEIMKEKSFQSVGQDFPVFLHPNTHEEYALARMERKTARGHQGFSFDYDPNVTLEEDLLRRDLTINAIAEAEDGSLVDPYGGLNDIKARVLRHVSPAFGEDPLRVLRLMRFYARFAPQQFTIAPETLALCREMVAEGELHDLTAERVWAECEKALSYAEPWHFFDGLAEVAALDVLLADAVPDTAVLAEMDAALKVACAQVDDVALRFAAWLRLCSACGEAALRVLRLPNKAKRWIELLMKTQDIALDWANTSAQDRWQLLKHCGSLRQAGDLADLLAVLGVDDALQQRIIAQAQAVQALDVGALQAEGHKGAALGAAIADAQRRILAG